MDAILLEKSPQIGTQREVSGPGDEKAVFLVAVLSASSAGRGNWEVAHWTLAVLLIPGAGQRPMLVCSTIAAGSDSAAGLRAGTRNRAS